MKSSKQTIILAAALLCFSSAVASPVSPERAAKVARNFFMTLGGTKSQTALVPQQGADWQFDGIYLFAGEDGGFVLVSADDATRPILGYSPSGKVDAANMPPQLRVWLQGYQREIDALSESKAPAAARYAAEWRALEQGLDTKQKSTAVVGPLLTTFWDQTYPYDALCPRGTVTGCAATAQAQVMNFWQYPSLGEGSHKYTHPRYGEQRADFGHTIYDWQHMPVRASISSSDEEVMAVATLMYHCGVSLEMIYGTAAQGGSSAAGLAGVSGIKSIDNSLKDYFHYRRDLRVIFKDEGFSNADWRDSLIAELDLGHPIVYAGAAEQGGHGFVCDGYDDRGYVHFNFGWSGTGDGFFPVDSISPGVGGVGGNVTYTFNMNNAALLGLVPDYALRVSDTLVCLPRDAAEDSVIVSLNEKVAGQLRVEDMPDWLSCDLQSLGQTAHAGWVHLRAAENNSGADRVALLTFSQGNEQTRVKVVQSAYSPEELCPVTVVMESTRDGGWQGDAHLSLESENGYVYGLAKLADGRKDSVQVAVCPHHLHAVWRSGGGTDRYVNYTVKNLYGETLLAVQYAYRNGGNHDIEWPCAHLGIQESTQESAAPTLYPNPVSDVLTIRAEGLLKVELTTVDGRSVMASGQSRIDVSGLPRGAYFVRVVTTTGSSVHKVVKK